MFVRVLSSDGDDTTRASQPALFLLVHTHTHTGFACYYRELRDFLYAQPDIGSHVEIVGMVDVERTGQFVVRWRRRLGNTDICDNVLEPSLFEAH